MNSKRVIELEIENQELRSIIEEHGLSTLLQTRSLSEDYGEPLPTIATPENTILLPATITAGPSKAFVCPDDAMDCLPELYNICYSVDPHTQSVAYIMAAMDDHHMLRRRDCAKAFVGALMVASLLPFPKDSLSEMKQYARRTAHNVSTTLHGLKPGYHSWGRFDKWRHACEKMGNKIESYGYKYSR